GEGHGLGRPHRRTRPHPMTGPRTRALHRKQASTINRTLYHRGSYGRRARRILPEAVRGSSSTISTTDGSHCSANRVRTHVFSASANSSESENHEAVTTQIGH